MFNVSSEGLRVSAVAFSDIVMNRFWLNEHLDTNSTITAVSSIPYIGGLTETGKALRFVHWKNFCICRGARSSSDKTLVVLTDGRSENNDETVNEARTLHQSKINVIAIGIANYDEGELHDIASQPGFVFKLQTFSALSSIIGLIQNTICSIAGEPTTTKVQSTTQGTTSLASASLSSSHEGISSTTITQYSTASSKQITSMSLSTILNNDSATSSQHTSQSATRSNTIESSLSYRSTTDADGQTETSYFAKTNEVTTRNTTVSTVENSSYSTTAKDSSKFVTSEILDTTISNTANDSGSLTMDSPPTPDHG